MFNLYLSFLFFLLGCDISSTGERLSGNGQDYRGCQTKTRSGRTCQAWDSQKPHKHDRTPENLPNYGLEGNYCRNPGKGATIWCLTTDPNKMWEYCDPIMVTIPEPEVPS